MEKINTKNKRTFKFRIFDRKTKKEIKAEFYGDILVGEQITMVRHYRPNNNGGYSYYRSEIFNNCDLIIELVS